MQDQKEVPNIYIVDLQDWRGLFAINPIFLSNFIFRGQSNSKWALSTSIERHIATLHSADSWRNNTHREYEKKMLKEFKWKYPIYEQHNIPKYEDNIEWLSIMQHYGVPTRLLDFSKSLYVAMFMAINGCIEEYEDASIWMFNKKILTIHSYNSDKSRTGSYISDSDLKDHCYKDANSVLNGEKSEQLLFLIEPKIGFERISRQQGVFVMPSQIDNPFENVLQKFCNMETQQKLNSQVLIKYSYDHPDPLDKISLIKINIPFKYKYLIMQSLEHMNITAEILYSGLDGLAKYVSRLRDFDYSLYANSTPAEDA